MVLISLSLGLAPPTNPFVVLGVQLKGCRSGDFPLELVASCSGEGVTWKRFVLGLLRSAVAEPLKKLLTTGLRALAGTFSSLPDQHVCGLPEVPLAMGLFSRRVLLWYAYPEWIKVAVAGARIGVVVGGVVVVGL